MNCCPQATFEFLGNGLLVHEKQIQADGYTQQFFPYSGIKTVRYAYVRGETGGTISIWVAEGLSYRYLYPCGEAGNQVFELILARL